MPTILAKWGGRRGTDYALSKVITIPAWKKKDHVCASDGSCRFRLHFVKHGETCYIRRQVLWFCDNEAARSAMIRSYSPLLDSMQLIRLCAAEDVAAQSTNWYARVPSKSNLSDAASRLDFSCYALLGFTKVMPKLGAHDLG